MNFDLQIQKPLRELVYEELKHKILTGEIASQTRLMEIDLAEKMNVSRTPIREAIRELAADGLVTIEPRRGAYVSRISIDDMLDVFEVRENLEGFAAYLAAKKVDRTQTRVLPTFYLCLFPYAFLKFFFTINASVRPKYFRINARNSS